jgi:hypothetical protein
MRLYHFTAIHLARQIIADGIIKPHSVPRIFYRLPAPPVIWLTDIAEPDELTNGLTSENIAYSRVAARFQVDVTATKWHRFASRYGVIPAAKSALTMGGKIDHHHWFVVTVPIPVTPSMLVLTGIDTPSKGRIWEGETA